jgi:hypothetical protein
MQLTGNFHLCSFACGHPHTGLEWPNFGCHECIVMSNKVRLEVTLCQHFCLGFAARHIQLPVFGGRHMDDIT